MAGQPLVLEYWRLRFLPCDSIISKIKCVNSSTENPTRIGIRVLYKSLLVGWATRYQQKWKELSKGVLLGGVCIFMQFVSPNTGKHRIDLSMGK